MSRFRPAGRTAWRRASRPEDRAACTAAEHRISRWVDRMAAADLTEPRCASERGLAMGGGPQRSVASRWEDFARELLPDDYDEVRHIFSRRVAYRRYKDLLVRRAALERWYDFSNKSEEAALREWCAENGIELSGT